MAPSLYNFLRYAYGTSVPLHLGSSLVMSETGTHQGCPLGPVGFALGIQDPLGQLSTQGGLLWNSWYLDDGCLVGTPESLNQAYPFLQEAFAERGLQLNAAKCRLWGPAACLATGCDGVPVTPWTPEEGITLLGCPIAYPGSTTHVERRWNAVPVDLKRATERVTQVVDTQVAHHLLQACLDACKVNHLLRATNAYRVGDLVRQCDKYVTRAFEDLLGSSLSPTQCDQVALPLSVGGCGLRLPSRVRPAA